MVSAGNGATDMSMSTKKERPCLGHMQNGKRKIFNNDISGFKQIHGHKIRKAV
jgi:hypothetical protein